MATFPNIAPAYGAQKTTTANTRTVQFGDGYQQRLLVGMARNQMPRTWALTWNVSETDGDVIETFLDSRLEDSASFDWTPIGENVVRKWVCASFQKSIPYKDRVTINATFRQVFEP